MSLRAANRYNHLRPMKDPRDQLRILKGRIVTCRRCPRLVKYRETVAREKRRSFADWVYWGKPVPGFGDSRAELLILGLAPAAHGANRTGRMFTGDRSGDFLFEMLHRAGFANQASSRHAEDGLELRGAYLTAAVRCAPPANKPRPAEILNCRPYLEEELALLQPPAVLALGKIAFDAYLALLKARGDLPRATGLHFKHGASYSLPGGLPHLFAAYHPSQQNTFTGKLTPVMFQRVLREIRRYLRERRINRRYTVKATIKPTNHA